MFDVWLLLFFGNCSCACLFTRRSLCVLVSCYLWHIACFVYLSGSYLFVSLLLLDCCHSNACSSCWIVCVLLILVVTSLFILFLSVVQGVSAFDLGSCSVVLVSVMLVGSPCSLCHPLFLFQQQQQQFVHAFSLWLLFAMVVSRATSLHNVKNYLTVAATEAWFLAEEQEGRTTNNNNTNKHKNNDNSSFLQY